MIGTDGGPVKRRRTVRAEPDRLGLPVRKSSGALRRTDGLRPRTGSRTVPHMFRRHHTTPDRDLSAVAEAFHERLAASARTRSLETPRIEPRNLRRRLASPSNAGLRDRMGRGLSAG